MLVSLIAALSTVTFQGPKSLFEQIVPNPTGRNGYEEYLRAADLAISGDYASYERWLAAIGQPKRDLPIELPPMPTNVTADMSDLAVRKRANDQLGSVVDLVRSGNQKSVFDPRKNISISTTFPELGPFKTVGKVIMNRAHVEFSSGQTSLAVNDLLEGLTFSWNLIGDTILSSLVGIACESIMLAEFNEHLGQLSPGELAKIDKFTTAMLGKPFLAADLFENEQKITLSQIDVILAKPSSVIPDLEPNSFPKTYLTAIEAMSAAERQSLSAATTAAIKQRMEPIVERLRGPETGWIDRGSDTEVKYLAEDVTIPNLATAIANSVVSKNTERQITNAIGKARIQIRLLRLHAKALNYHWQTNHWPTKIEQFADKQTAFDPISNSSFVYEMQEGNYRLYSLGVPGVGPIELKYRSTGYPPVSKPGPIPPH